MCYNAVNSLIIIFIAQAVALQPQLKNDINSLKEKYTVQKGDDDGKSSLVFVFDTTGSMYNDLRQLREGAEMILKTALEEGDVIGDFVFVPFHDPVVGPATVTTSKRVFKSALNIVRVYGGGDCPEKSLTGITLALNVSRPHSYIYVFTDATAADHRLVGKVLDAVQRKQSQVVFVLTGHCNDLHRPSYKVYQQIAAASSGQVFNLNKTSVHKVLDFVKSSIKGKSVNLGSVIQPAKKNFTQNIPVDSTLAEVTVSVSGAKPKIKVVNPSGELLTGPPKLVTTLDLSEIMVVKVMQPEPGNWSITVGSDESYSVKVVGVSNLTFNHGFSVEKPETVEETSYRPMKGTYNHMLISLTQADAPVDINYAEITSLMGKTLFEVPLRKFNDEQTYIADAFVPPDDFFYIAIRGHDQYNQELRRIGATAVQAKVPDVPYITAPRAMDGRFHERVVLKCYVESLVPVTAVWMKDGKKIGLEKSSLQSTSIDYEIEDMSEEHVGTYNCFAKNVAGNNKALTEVTVIVDPPLVSISPANKTVVLGEDVTISCTVFTEVLLEKFNLVYNGTSHKYYKIHVEPSIDGVYKFNKTVKHMSKNTEGLYSCVAANRGGQSRQSTYITVQSAPTAQLLGPHTITKHIHADMQIVCSVENAERMQWIAPNHTVVSEIQLDGSLNAVLDVRNVTEDGVWKCAALMGDQRATDTLHLNITIKPTATIVGKANVTILNGTSVDITCVVVAKPAPRIIWHRETEHFLNHTVILAGPNTYRSVLTLNSSLEPIAGTYFCYGENSEGIAHDNATVNIRRKMVLVEGFKDQSVQLYSQVEFHCTIDTYPRAIITWQHNGTIITTRENIYLSEDNTTLSISNVGFEDLGLYSCEADNGFEKLDLNGTLSVWGLEYPMIVKENDTVVARRGHSANISCRMSQGNPEPIITWQYRSDSSEIFGELPQNVKSDDEGIELIISNVTVDNIGTYRCIAENIIGRDVFDITFIVQYPPHLKQTNAELKEQKPIEVEAGHSVTLSCEADGMPPPLVVWYKDQRPVVFSKNVYLTDANDLVLKEVTPYDSAVFTCTASSILGTSERNFTLTIYDPPKLTSPEIEPVLEVLEGQLVELPCSGRGVPKPEVTWLQNGEPVVERRKYVDDYGMRFVANLTDFGEYKCIFKNKYGTTSISFNIYIWVPPSIEPPLHISENILAGSNVTFECNVVGFPIPNILWEFGDQILTENTTILSFNEYGSLFINNASSKHEGVYACAAENLAGVTRKYIRLNVNEPPTVLANNYPGPYIATNMDTSLVITCNVAGKPKPYVVWIKDDYYLDNDDRYVIDEEGTLTIKAPSEELSGFYTCVAKNPIGEVNRTVSVEIYSLPTQVQSEQSEARVTLLEGANATVDCPVPHTDKDLVKWYKDAQVVSRGQLQFPCVSREQAATYACVVTTAVYTAYGALTLTVDWPPRLAAIRGGDTEVVRGDDCYFDCEADAKPAAKIKWVFNSRPLMFEDKPRLRLLSVQLRNTGTYKCIVSNKHGTVSKQFTLDVLEPPFISEFDLLDVQLKSGTNASLDCEARGSPKPDVTWTFNNTNWRLENSTLVTSNISPHSEGLFRCDATNKAGRTHIVYRVSIVSAAKIVEVVAYNGSAGLTVGDVTEVVLGSNVRISCRASGSPLPTIQWIRYGQVLDENDHEISYADLSLEDVQPSHGRVYSCIATNDAGVDERKVRVEVLEPPKIFQMLFENKNYSKNTINIEVISGQAFNLHCHPYGNPMPEVYWFKDEQPLRLFDDTMVSTDYGEVIVSKNAMYDQSGNYTCVARNKVGNTSVVYLVDVLVPPPTPKESSKAVNIRVGKPINLTCPVEGSPQPYVMWIKHPYTEIGEHTPRLSLLNDNFTLVINSSVVADSGKYSCIMTNKVGTTEIVFDVTVEKPPSITGNIGTNSVEKHVVPLRRSIVLKCEADGHPPPKITWLKDTQQLSSSLSNIQRVLGNSLLAVWCARVRDAGQYICVVENGAGSAHRRYNVAVQVPGKWSSWSQWSFCNVTCGLGYQHRARVCQYVDDDNITFDKTSKPDKVVFDESACKGLGTDRRKCHMPACEEELPPRWSVWSKWSPCSATCGVGTQARTRRCRTTAVCYGDNVQIRKCPSLPKCDSTPNSDENEVYSSQEEINATKSYNPEETYEFQPAVVNAPYSSDIEEFRLQDISYKESGYPKVAAPYYDVNVTDNLDHSDRGPCDPGFRHNTTSNSCDDIDECLIETNQCHATQVCVNTAGAYRCTCGKGYRALGPGRRCLDVNECMQDIHGCEFACVNVAGGYVCACPRRLRLHLDRRHCVEPALYREPFAFDQIETATEEYLSTSVDYPIRYTKYPTD